MRKQTKVRKGRKQVKAFKFSKPEEEQQDLILIEGLFPKELRSIEIKNKVDEILKIEDKNC